VLAKLNISTVGELRELSLEVLEALFGANGAVLYERCRGCDTRAVSECEVPKSISRETTFHRETIDPDEIHGMLYYLTERAALTMRGLGLACRRVGLHIRYSDFVDNSSEQRLTLPTLLDREVFEAALRLLKRLCTRRVSLRLIGITLSGFSAEGPHQVDMLDEERRVKLENLYRCLDKLRQKFGHSVVIAGNSLELLGKLRQDSYGYILRTPCLTK
jgi:DNA polymerase-4